MDYHKTPSKICGGKLDLLRCVFKKVIFFKITFFAIYIFIHLYFMQLVYYMKI